MNYRHAYHAGNFTEVFKHILLVGLLESLLEKDKPICFLDTHAGIGSYDLQSRAAQKTKEYVSGIAKMLHEKKVTMPKLAAHYWQVVSDWNTQKGVSDLQYYPGSPRIVRSLLRPQDRMILTELHPEDVSLLKTEFLKDPQVAVHHLDGYQALKAFLPPKEARGLVLIDPPFEKTDEFSQLFKQLEFAYQRWKTGVYAVWYPIKDKSGVKYFLRKLQTSGIRKILCCEITLPFFATTGLDACGMVVINPPWQWQEKIAAVLPWLCKILAAPETASFRLEWLVPE